MKKVINDPASVVEEMVTGILAAHPALRRLGEYKTIARVHTGAPKVAVISGGGSGHEPAHIGYIGEGMLDAVCAGDVFASPSSDQILEAIQEMNQGEGVLLVVKNYQGDRLNFALAADQALAEGIDVDQVVVADDISIGSTEDRRGVAGTVFVHKVAGAMAASGGSLREVKRVASKAVSGLASIGVALSPCVVPTAGVPTFTLDEDEIELGIGIHGERGLTKTSSMPATELCEKLFRNVQGELGLAAGSRIAVMINGMGATPLMELYIVDGIIHRLCAGQGWETPVNLVGTFMSSLEMAGFSITVMRLDEELERLLAMPTRAPAYPSA